MTAGETGEGDAPEPASYVVRVPRGRSALMVLAGGAALVASVGIAVAVHRWQIRDLLLVVLVAVGSISLIDLGARRIIVGRRHGWVAFAVDSDGVYLAGIPPNDEARRFTWDEVSAIVLFSRRTDFLQGAISCVGVRLHPVVTDSPEQHLARLERELSRPDLELHVWERLRRLDAGPSTSQLETAVSFHAEARGWGFRRARLKQAVRVHAPGVPVIGFSAHSYYDLVGWRADQDELRAILDGTEANR